MATKKQAAARAKFAAKARSGKGKVGNARQEHGLHQRGSAASS